MRSAIKELSEFFARNPDEELTAEDAAAKLGISVRTVDKYLRELMDCEIIQRVVVYKVVDIKGNKPRAY